MKLRQKLAVSYLRASVRVLAALSTDLAARRAFRLFCTPFNRARIRSIPLFDNAERLQFQVGGRNVVGHRWNHPQPRKFLLLHGFQSASRNFEKYISGMIKKGYEVLAFDAPAHGESSGKQTNVLQYREMIWEISGRYGPFDALLAHSFGGLAACLALEKMPHTTETNLVLIAPATETSTALQQLYGILGLNDATKTAVEKIIFEMGGQPVEWFSINRAIRNINARILWVQDEEDEITPLKDLQPIRLAAYPNISFMITKGLGHRRIYHDQQVMSAIFSFFQSPVT